MAGQPPSAPGLPWASDGKRQGPPNKQNGLTKEGAFLCQGDPALPKLTAPLLSPQPPPRGQGGKRSPERLRDWPGAHSTAGSLTLSVPEWHGHQGLCSLSVKLLPPGLRILPHPNSRPSDRYRRPPPPGSPPGCTDTGSVPSTSLHGTWTETRGRHCPRGTVPPGLPICLLRWPGSPPRAGLAVCRPPNPRLQGNRSTEQLCVRGCG